MISSFAKVLGLQSHLLLEKTEDQNGWAQRTHGPGYPGCQGTDNVADMTAVMILSSNMEAYSLCYCFFMVCLTQSSLWVNRKKTTYLVITLAVGFHI